MPHATIEYSANLSGHTHCATLVPTVHERMIASGLFNAADVKTRAYATQDFHVGEKGAAGSFIHVRIELMEGRTPQQRQALTTSIRDAVQALIPQADQLSVDIRDMGRETYRKAVV